jgi:signal transduction histidine kinase
MTNPTSGDRAATPAQAAARILIVDDEQSVCDVCTRTLRRCGYDVSATTNPQAAVAMLQDGAPFDLLLTDIKMPTMSGMDLAQIARDRDPAMAIIIMTGFASVEHLHMSVQRGVADFLSKPFEIEYLRLAVDQALHKRSILQDNLRLRTLEQLLSSSEALNASLDLAQFAEVLLRVSMAQSAGRAAFLLAPNLGQHAPLTAASDGATLHEAGRLFALRSLSEQRPLAGRNLIFATQGDIALEYALAIPLRAQGDVSGVLLLCDDRERLLRPGVQEEVMLLANHAGGALRNAALYSQLDEAYQRLQDLDQIKSEFLSIASHELRTPLSIVLGYSSMLRDQLTKDHREYLQRILDSAQRIKYIVDDMVSLRHIETGEAPPAFEPVSLQELVREGVDQFYSVAKGRRQSITLSLPPEELVFLCDREKMILVVKHLISNAIKFTPDGGEIDISATIAASGDIPLAQIVRRPAAPATLPWVVIAVRDTGIGIAEQELRRIFDRFYQVADSLTRDHGGIGLGLALVRELVAACDGAVWVNSRIGEGSTFSFAIPYRQYTDDEPQDSVG